MKKGNVYLQAGIWAILAEILVRAASFLATPVFTRILPMGVYGDVKTFEAWLSVLCPVLSLGLFTNIDVAQYRFKDCFRRYISAVVCLVLVLHLGYLGLYFLLGDSLARVTGFSPEMLLIVIGYSCFYCVILIQMRSDRIRLHYKRVAALSVVSTIPALAISILLTWMHRDDPAQQLLRVRILSFYIPIIIVGAFVAVMILIRNRFFFSTEYWKIALQISVPLIMYQISLQVLTQSDRIMIRQMNGSEKAAIFSVATSVIYIVEILHKGFETAWMPWLYRQLDHKEYALVNQGIEGVLIGFGLVLIGTALAGRLIIALLGGAGYEEGVWLLGPMLSGCVFQFFMLKLADIEKFYGQAGYVGAVSIAIALINLLLNYIGIRLWGYRAASYTTMISYVIADLIHLRIIRSRIQEIRLEGGKMLLLAAGITVVTILAMVVYRLSITASTAIAVIYGLALLGAFFACRKKLAEKIGRG